MTGLDFKISWNSNSTLYRWRKNNPKTLKVFLGSKAVFGWKIITSLSSSFRKYRKTSSTEMTFNRWLIIWMWNNYWYMINYYKQKTFSSSWYKDVTIKVWVILAFLSPPSLHHIYHNSLMLQYKISSYLQCISFRQLEETNQMKKY